MEHTVVTQAKNKESLLLLCNYETVLDNCENGSMVFEITLPIKGIASVL